MISRRSVVKRLEPSLTFGQVKVCGEDDTRHGGTKQQSGVSPETALRLSTPLAARLSLATRRTMSGEEGTKAGPLEVPSTGGQSVFHRRLGHEENARECVGDNLLRFVLPWGFPATEKFVKLNAVVEDLMGKFVCAGERLAGRRPKR